MTALLMKLRQFARYDRRPRPEHRFHIGETLSQTLRGLEKNERGRNALQFRKSRAAFAAFRRKESCKHEPVRRQTGNHEGGEGGRGAGYRVNGKPLGDCFADELIARVRHEGRARVADQRHPLTVPQASQKPGPDLGCIVIVVGKERLGNAIDREQLRGHPRVFGHDRIAGFEHIERPQGDIAGIADGCRNDVKTGREQFLGRILRIRGLAHTLRVACNRHPILMQRWVQ